MLGGDDNKGAARSITKNEGDPSQSRGWLESFDMLKRESEKLWAIVRRKRKVIYGVPTLKIRIRAFSDFEML